MRHHLNIINLKKTDFSAEQAKIKDLKYLVKEEREPDNLIREEFPLHTFGDYADDELRIYGSKDLLINFDRIDDEKLDIKEKIKNISFIGFADNKSLIFRFEKDEINVKGIYEFNYDLLNYLFNMGKFSTYCLEKGYKDVLRQNIEELMLKIPNKQLQYRLLKYNNEYLIRGFTTLKYNNYDNHLALYLCLLALHRYANDKDIYFNIERATISDSEIRVYFEQDRPTMIPGFCNVYFGVCLINNEIKGRAFTLELRYRLEDFDGRSFGSMADLKDAVFQIHHQTGINNVINKLKNVYKIRELHYKNLKYFTSLMEMSTITDDFIYKLFKGITNANTEISGETRQSFKSLYDNNVINNAMTIFETFNRVNELTTDIDELLYLERIYYKVIREVSK
jgi:hypothetical protein